jgi:hypothetical protein
MTEYSNENRGSIWKNEKKDKDTHPDFTGSLNVNGQDYWVSAWKRKEGANPKAPALSFTVKPKEEQQSISQRAMPKQNSYASATGRQDPISSGSDDMDDRIPF